MTDRGQYGDSSESGFDRKRFSREHPGTVSLMAIGAAGVVSLAMWAIFREEGHRRAIGGG